MVLFMRIINDGGDFNATIAKKTLPLTPSNSACVCGFFGEALALFLNEVVGAVFE